MHGDDYVPQNVPRLADSCKQRVPRQAQQGGEPGHHERSRISHQGHIPRHKWQVSWHKCQGKTHYSWVMVHWVTKVPQLYHPSCKVCWWVLVHTGPTLGASQVFCLCMVWSVDPLLIIIICCKKLVELELGSGWWMIDCKCFKGLEYSPHLVGGCPGWKGQ